MYRVYDINTYLSLDSRAAVASAFEALRSQLQKDGQLPQWQEPLASNSVQDHDGLVLPSYGSPQLGREMRPENDALVLVVTTLCWQLAQDFGAEGWPERASFSPPCQEYN